MNFQLGENVSEIKLSKPQQESAVSKLQGYFEQELDRELDQFEGEFLLQFVLKELGPAIYNQALYDAQSVLNAKIEDTFAEIEQFDTL